MGDFFRVKHSVNIGDCVADLWAARKASEITGKKIIWCQKLGVLGAYPIGTYHPTRNENDAAVCCNQKMLDMITPLLLAQDYIAGVEEYIGQPVDCDFDEFRQKTFVNLGFGAIAQWPMLAFPNLGADISVPSVHVADHPQKEEYKDKILINFTDRYRNHIINYFFLKKYEQWLIFAGTPKEHEAFCKEWRLSIPLLMVNDFLELAQIMKACRFMVGNQSFNWNLAEAMKTPRILEMGPSNPNCQPFIGEHSYGFYHQIGLEYYFKKLFTDTANEKKRCPCCNGHSVPEFVKSGSTYWRCHSCNTVYVPDGLDNDNMVGGGFEVERNEKENLIRIGRILALTGKKDFKCLDYGCGHGLLVKDFLHMGIDAKGYDKFNPDYSAPRKEQYDVVTMIEVIEHLSEPFIEIDEIHNRLNKGGFIYLETSFTDIWPDPIQDSFYVDPLVGHSTIFSHMGLDQLMTKKGFTIGNHINSNARIYIK